MSFSPHDFAGVTAVLRARSGIALGVNKAYLLEARIAPVMTKHKFRSTRELSAALMATPPPGLMDDFIECMTTNETLFFRDQKPFELIDQDVLQQLRIRRAGAKRIRIWCAAASTGQEPYSLAILFDEQRERWRDWKIDIVASDLSHYAVQKAQRGLYSQFEVQRGLPIRLLMKYFTQVGNDWEISPEIRAAVNYQYFNLLGDPVHLGQFDLILVRNVLIYFDVETKKQTIARIGRALAPDGYLILGAAETTLHYTDAFRPLRPDGGLYVKQAFAPAATS